MDKTDEVLREIETKKTARFMPILGREKGYFLEKLLKKYKPSRVLEIGCLMGYSTIRIARNVKKGEVVSVEISRSAVEAASENLKKAGSSNVEFVRGAALDVIPKLSGKFDFVFIDAVKVEYLGYLKLLEENDLLEQGAVIVADNIGKSPDETKEYVEYVRKSGKYSNKNYDFKRDSVEVSVRI